MNYNLKRNHLNIILQVFNYQIFFLININFIGTTDFGIAIVNKDLQNIFNNDPLQSKIFLDYHLFDTPEDLYRTDYINSNSLKLPLIRIHDFVSGWKNNNFCQEYYNK